MSEFNDGGPAFPFSEPYMPNTSPPKTFTGMTLRDFFAAKAMASVISNCGPMTGDDSAEPWASEKAPNVDEVAVYAYAQADAMLVAREAA